MANRVFCQNSGKGDRTSKKHGRYDTRLSRRVHTNVAAYGDGAGTKRVRTMYELALTMRKLLMTLKYLMKRRTLIDTKKLVYGVCPLPSKYCTYYMVPVPRTIALQTAGGELLIDRYFKQHIRLMWCPN